MGTVTYLADKLTNALLGTGTRRDALTANAYSARALTQPEIEAAYRGSGLMRKIVQIPALDMVREWREWTGLDADEAAKLYDAEKSFGLVRKVREAEVLRALGGGALILGLPGNPSEPAPENAPLAFLHVVSRWQLNFDTLETDAREPTYGEPQMWTLSDVAGQARIHPSRIIPFRADTSALAASTARATADAFWGESVVAQVLDAVQHSDLARSSFAALINKARSLRIGIPGLMQLVSSKEGAAQVQSRLDVMAQAESIHNAFVFDAGDSEGKGGEQITDSAYTFAGVKDVLAIYGEFVAAISDIPATRLLGRAPEGMNASGDSQQQDWSKRIRAQQTLDLAPCLDRLDPHLFAAAKVSTDKAAYDFAPLDMPSEKERAERFKLHSEALEKIAGLSAMSERAFARGAQSLLVAEGYLPELEAALADEGDETRYGLELPGTEEGGDLPSAGESGGNAPARRAANDAQPRPLYVKRNLLNAADLVAWAKENGFETTLPAEDMHVTVLYSRAAVDPLDMGETWGTEDNGDLIIKPGGPRALERFNEGAVVLQFASWSLTNRHRDMRERGASHDWPEYLPHITLSYQAGDIDLEKLTPYTGELHFGPEIFEPLDEDWKRKIEET